MILSPTASTKFYLPWLLLAILAGCANSTVRPLPVAASAPVVIEGRPAVVAAIREVDISPGDGSLAGVNAVLAALSQSAANGHISATEVVVSQPGNIPASVGGPYTNLAAGQHITISDAGGRPLLRAY